LTSGVTSGSLLTQACGLCFILVVKLQLHDNDEQFDRECEIMKWP